LPKTRAAGFPFARVFRPIKRLEDIFCMRLFRAIVAQAWIAVNVRFMHADLAGNVGLVETGFLQRTNFYTLCLSKAGLGSQFWPLTFGDAWHIGIATAPPMP